MKMLLLFLLTISIAFSNTEPLNHTDIPVDRYYTIWLMLSLEACEEGQYLDFENALCYSTFTGELKDEYIKEAIHRSTGLAR